MIPQWGSSWGLGRTALKDQQFPICSFRAPLPPEDKESRSHGGSVCISALVLIYILGTRPDFTFIFDSYGIIHVGRPMVKGTRYPNWLERYAMSPKVVTYIYYIIGFFQSS
jgi:hypothetical protein